MIYDSVYPLGKKSSLLDVSNWNHRVPEFEFEFPAEANVLPVWNTSLKTHQEKLHISALSAPWVLQPLLSCRGCVASYYRPISQKRHSRSFSAVSASPLYGVRDILIADDTGTAPSHHRTNPSRRHRAEETAATVPAERPLPERLLQRGQHRGEFVEPDH